MQILIITNVKKFQINPHLVEWAYHFVFAQSWRKTMVCDSSLLCSTVLLLQNTKKSFVNEFRLELKGNYFKMSNLKVYFAVFIYKTVILYNLIPRCSVDVYKDHWLLSLKWLSHVKNSKNALLKYHVLIFVVVYATNKCVSILHFRICWKTSSECILSVLNNKHQRLLDSNQ